MKKIEIHPKAKALIFDLDGTLADTMPIHFQAYKNVLSPYGIVFTPDLFVAMAGIPAYETIQKLNEQFGTCMDPKETSGLKELEYENIMHKMRPVIPVVELAKKYHGIFPMAIGTGGYKRLAMKTLKIIGLDTCFEIIITGDDITHPKPHPETFLRCSDLLGIEPAFCQVFEDGPLGIKAAEAAGMIPTLVTEFYEVTIGQEV